MTDCKLQLAPRGHNIVLLISHYISKYKTLLRKIHVQNLWTSSFKFDAVLVEQFSIDCPVGLACILGVSVVGITANYASTLQPRPEWWNSKFQTGLPTLQFKRWGLALR
ncbi:unnamed protein product [Leptidea sinapis]|uniref:Uncharacterized protein n=1 Tax=Leptidea sinapis TaxID=189913 RepID=A0A5E4Q4S8_9NEOP|nr:unnamed protein product [Leptidea sinapis]